MTLLIWLVEHLISKGITDFPVPELVFQICFSSKFLLLLLISGRTVELWLAHELGCFWPRACSWAPRVLACLDSAHASQHTTMLVLVLAVFCAAV